MKPATIFYRQDMFFPSFWQVVCRTICLLIPTLVFLVSSSTDVFSASPTAGRIVNDNSASPCGSSDRDGDGIVENGECFMKDIFVSVKVFICGLYQGTEYGPRDQCRCSDYPGGNGCLMVDRNHYDYVEFTSGSYKRINNITWPIKSGNSSNLSYYNDGYCKIQMDYYDSSGALKDWVVWRDDARCVPPCTAATAPGTPTGLTPNGTTPTSKSNIALSWVAGAVNGGTCVTPYTSYVVNVTGPGSTAIVSNAVTTNTSYTIPSVSEGGTYNWNVKQCNDSARTRCSAVANATFNFPATPPSCSNLTFSPVSPSYRTTDVTVTVTAADAESGLSKIDFYANSATDGTTPADKWDLFGSVTGLAGAKTYTGGVVWPGTNTTSHIPGTHKIAVNVYDMVGNIKPWTDANGCSGTYTLTNYGGLTITAGPSTITAPIYINGVFTANNNWSSNTLTPGTVYTVNFGDVSGWIKPAGQAVTIIGGQMQYVNVAYYQGGGNVTGFFFEDYDKDGVMDAGEPPSSIGVMKLLAYRFSCYCQEMGFPVAGPGIIIPPCTRDTEMPVCSERETPYPPSIPITVTAGGNFWYTAPGGAGGDYNFRITLTNALRRLTKWSTSKNPGVGNNFFYYSAGQIAGTSVFSTNSNPAAEYRPMVRIDGTSQVLYFGLTTSTTPQVPTLISPPDNVWLNKATGIPTVLTVSVKDNGYVPVDAHFDLQSAPFSDGTTDYKNGFATYCKTIQFGHIGTCGLGTNNISWDTGVSTIPDTNDTGILWRAKAEDAGTQQSGWSGSWKLKKDTVSPSVSFSTPSVSGNTVTFSWVGSDATPGSGLRGTNTYDYTPSFTPLGLTTSQPWAGCPSGWGAGPGLSVSCAATGSGDYKIVVNAYDAAGNIGTQTNTKTIAAACVDTTPPSVPGGLRPNAVCKRPSTFNTAWDASTDSLYCTAAPINYIAELSLSNTVKATGEFTSPLSTPITINTSSSFPYAVADLSSLVYIPGNSPKTVYFHVRSRDSSGNLSNWSSIISQELLADPIVTSTDAVALDGTGNVTVFAPGITDLRVSSSFDFSPRGTVCTGGIKFCNGWQVERSVPANNYYSEDTCIDNPAAKNISNTFNFPSSTLLEDDCVRSRATVTDNASLHSITSLGPCHYVGYTSWFQSINGDVYGTRISEIVSSTTPPNGFESYMIANDVVTGTYPATVIPGGLAISEGTITVTGTSDSNKRSSERYDNGTGTTRWEIPGYTGGLAWPSEVLSSVATTPDIPTDDILYYPSNIAITASATPAAGEVSLSTIVGKVVVSSGDITIKGDVKSNPGGVGAAGSRTFDINAVLIAEGKIIIEDTSGTKPNNANDMVKIKGGLFAKGDTVSNGVVINRELGNNKFPAVVVAFDPAIFARALNKLSVSRITWKEIVN